MGESVKTVLEPQVSFVLMDQKTGNVKAISGGRGEKTASLSLNRATDTTRQPGSTFKVISTFAPAIDASGATLATTYYDSEYTIGNKTFQNWYDKQGYLGWSNIREGIIYSMNIVALKTLMETVTTRVGVQYATDFGITTLTDQDYSASLALGGLTNGVTNLELTGAFATIANGGVYREPVFFTKIVDHNGKTLIDTAAEPVTHRVLKDSTAFLLTDAMAASTENNRKFARSGVNVNSTSTRAHLDHMSVAGKSGTTTKNIDAWFVGFTPYYTAGVWAGCDENQTLSDNGGTSFHKDIWKKIMNKVSEGYDDIGFPVPDSVETAVVCRKSGKLPIPGVCEHDPRGDATYTEYFAKGTVPTEVCDHHTSVTVCSHSGLLPTPNCPTTTKVALIVPSGASTTDDSYFAAPGDTCNIHGGGAVPDSHPTGGGESDAVGVSPSTAASHGVIESGKPTGSQNKNISTTPPNTAAPAPTTAADDSGISFQGPGSETSAPSTDGPGAANPAPTISTEGPGYQQVSPRTVGPGND